MTEEQKRNYDLLVEQEIKPLEEELLENFKRMAGVQFLVEKKPDQSLRARNVAQCFGKDFS